MTLNTVAWRQLFSEFFVYFFWGINLGNSVVPKPTKLWISPPLPPTCQRSLDPLDHSTFGLFFNKNGSLYIKENLSQIEGMRVWLFAAFSVLGWFPSTFPGYPNCWVVTSKLDQNFHGLSQAWILDFVMLAFFFQMVVRLHPSTTTNNTILGKTSRHTSSLSFSAFSWVKSQLCRQVYPPSAHQFVSRPDLVVDLENFATGEKHLLGTVTLWDPIAGEEMISASKVYVGEFSQSLTSFEMS